MLGGWLALFVALLLTVGAGAQLSCDRAIELHEWALDQLGNCSDPATQNTPICELVGQYESQPGLQAGATPGAEDPSMSDQLMLVDNSVQGIQTWQNFLVEAAMVQVADLGEISYILSLVNDSYSSLTAENTTNDDYFAAWQLPWWNQADAVAAYAYDSTNNLDALSTSEQLWKAANYYFTGYWPYPFSTESLSRAQDSVDAFKAGLDAHPSWVGFYFTSSFNNGSATAELPGIFITPDDSRPLPLLIITGGTDYPKEMNVLQFGLAALNRGYAFLVYDGPGQGETIRQPPNMPFYPAWEEVLSSILDYVTTELTDYVQVDNIAQEGVSLGGYLGARACSGNSDRLVACLPNPPQTNVASVYSRFPETLAQAIYAPFQYAGQQDPTLLPEGYANDFQDYPEIIDAILQTCDADSGAPELLAEALSSGQPDSPIDPELVYLAGGYGGAVTGDTSELYSAIWQSLQNVQNFGEYDVGNITVPVIGFKGTQDDLLGGQEDEFFSRLNPEIADNSTLVVLDGASGGALHTQVGSPYLLAARQFALLNPIMSEKSAEVALQ